MNKVLLFSFFILIGCKNNASNGTIQQEEKSNQYDCVIPDEVINYISSHSDEFKLINANEELIPLDDFVPSGECPIMCFGDFNGNGKEDVALILRYRGYKNPDYPDYIFPFLVVFNDYKEQITPFIIYKTGDYEDESIKTVIYEGEGNGKLSVYLEKGQTCNKDVIDIIYPEKSAFFVFWNNQTLQYELLNYLDDDICEEVNDSPENKLLGSWNLEGRSIYAEPAFVINDSIDAHLTIATNISYIQLKKLQNSDNSKIHYKFKCMFSKDENSIYDIESSYYNDEPIVEVTRMGKNRIEFKWLGFYDKDIKKYVYTDNPFNSSKSAVILVKCDR